MPKLMLILTLLWVVYLRKNLVSCNYEEEFESFMLRMDRRYYKMLAKQAEQQKIKERNRNNLQFEDEAIFNQSHQIQIEILNDLNYITRELEVLQLIGTVDSG